MRFLLALAVIAITVYSVIDCVGGDDRRRRGLPAWLWVTVIIVLPGVGGLVWLAVSRMAGEQRPRPPVRPARPVAPDDDPDFLADLSRRVRPEQTPAAPPPEDSPKDSGSEQAEDSADDGAAHPDEEPPTGEQPTGERDRGRRSPE